MRITLLILICITLIIPGVIRAQDTIVNREFTEHRPSHFITDRPWTIEIPLWIPGYAGSFAYGDIDIEGEDGVPVHPIEPPEGGALGKIFSRLFTDNWYLKFFFITRIAYEKDRFLAQFDALSGSVGESVEFNYNKNSVVQANYRTTNFRFFGGYNLINTYSKNKKFQYELYGYLGMRMHVHKVYSDLDGFINKLDINPLWIEPIIGIQNQFTLNRWYFVIQGDYGGYFVRSKYSFQLSSYVYFRTGKRTSMKLGWNHLDLNHSGNFLKEDYQIKATLSGPSVGIAFHF